MVFVITDQRYFVLKTENDSKTKGIKVEKKVNY